MNWKEKQHWLCKDCGKDTFQHANTDYYMVKFSLWAEFGVGKEMLCIKCLEKRMGRKLTKDDLLNCPVNRYGNETTMKLLNNSTTDKI